MTEEYRKDYISWDECFMQIANIASMRSKDPSTQVGAVVVTDDDDDVGLGYNGFPRGVDIDAFPWKKEGDFVDTKYAYVCHAEENAIYNANNSTKGCRVYGTLFPCNECAKTIIQNGITEVIYESDKYNHEPPFIAAKRMFDAAGIKHRQYQSDYSKTKSDE